MRLAELKEIVIDKKDFNSLENLPHFAIFLNDVQRKGHERNFGINSTFLAAHFKGYTIALTPLDGVYYCDLRPIMRNDAFLSRKIKTFDNLLVQDIWQFMG